MIKVAFFKGSNMLKYINFPTWRLGFLHPNIIFKKMISPYNQLLENFLNSRTYLKIRLVPLVCF